MLELCSRKTGRQEAEWNVLEPAPTSRHTCLSHTNNVVLFSHVRRLSIPVPILIAVSCTKLLHISIYQSVTLYQGVESGLLNGLLGNINKSNIYLKGEPRWKQQNSIKSNRTKHFSEKA